MNDCHEPKPMRLTLPQSLYPKREDAEAQWRRSAEDQGYEPCGPLTVNEIPLSDAERAMFGVEGGMRWEVVGPVQRVIGVAPPTFVPSPAAVELAGERLAAKTHPGKDWDDLPAHVKNHFATIALELINVAGQHLVADAVAHVANHPHAYGIDRDGQAVAQSVAMAVRSRLIETV